MATSTPKEIYAGYLPASDDILYTVPSGRTLMITRCAILNTTGTDRTANLYLVTSGGTATAINQILKAKEVDANMQEPYLVAGAERQILEAGGTIRGSATAASAVNAVISGILITTS